MRRYDNIDYVAIGQRLRKFRELRGLTQDELGAQSGFATSHIGHVEKASTKISLPGLITLANVLNVTVDDFLADNLTNPEPLRNELTELLKDCPPKKEKYLLKMLKYNSEVFDQCFPNLLDND